MKDYPVSRIALIVQGQVQGVGFRPFVWRLARDEMLSGNVANTSAGVCIEIQGTQDALTSFENRLRHELPRLARITHIRKENRVPDPDSTSFEILASEEHGGQNVLVSADVAICEDCIKEIRDPENRRFAYPFTNCTNCGPRYSITSHIPYDRPSTTMACFPLCPQCNAEYANPADRRFHAQPIACAECGPEIWFVEKGQRSTQKTPGNQADALAKAGQLIMQGRILAMRGLGGFQLVCDAKNLQAVQTLRQRKNRPHKALAMMAPNLAAISDICQLSPHATALLTGLRKPIVLCNAHDRQFSHIAPDTQSLGLMLPYTPLHTLLLDWLEQHSPATPLLVMTSANPPGEPICLGNREALERLNHLADGFLLHNRDILCRVDDSVVQPDNQGIIIRRARGYTPEPVELEVSGSPVLGTGAELKATFCLTRNNQAFLSQHIGDLHSPANMEFYESALKHLQNLLDVQPTAIVHDLHPDFLSTQFARQLADKLRIPCIALQHHAAHAAACLAEHNIFQPSLALCLDGTGLGVDNTIWGGELLQINLSTPSFHRLGHLSPFPMPGGDAAIREPWRLAASLRWLLNRNQPGKPGEAVQEMLKKNINSPLTSSCGRLFDAVAAELNLCHKITYEGQAAIRLEDNAQNWFNPVSAHEIPIKKANEMLQLDSRLIFHGVLAQKERGCPTEEIAATFHKTLALGFARLARQAACSTGIKTIALSGGVMQNTLFAGLLRAYLQDMGMRVLEHKEVPPGDGGLALGQAVWGIQYMKGKKI